MVSNNLRVFYHLIPSAIGKIGMLWVQKNTAPLIIHIILPKKNIPITEPQKRAHSPQLVEAKRRSRPSGAAGLGSESQNSKLPYGRRLPAACCGELQTISKNCPVASEQSHEKLKKLCLQIQNFLEGSPVSFSLEFIDITVCYDFQKRVLLETRQIPRGKVSCYGRLADKILAPGAARAVGSALARNPFPLIIPCHRVVKSTGYLGNFGGGSEMKRFLLQIEGVPSNTRGKIGPEYFR